MKMIETARQTRMQRDGIKARKKERKNLRKAERKIKISIEEGKKDRAKKNERKKNGNAKKKE